ncbi:MAG: alpha/beta hydrolase [Candidatus Dormiibacterota bacterium]
MAWQSTNVVVNGARVHYLRSGGSGPPLLLLHGFSDSGGCWSRVAHDLEDSYDVVMPDARGHGRSERAGGPVDAAQRVADAAGLITALRLHRPAVAGHSMGAMTAAALEVAHPELVGCLVLEDPAWREPQPAQPAGPGRWDYLRRCQEMPLEQVPDYCHELHPTWAPAEVEPWVEAKRQFDLTLLDGPMPESPPWRETAASIGCPTLLVTGDPELGAIVTEDVAAEAAALSGCRVEHIAAAGHNIRREQYGRYHIALLGFLHAEYPPQ